MNSATIDWDLQNMDFHSYVNKEITFVGSNDIMMYARGKTYTPKHLFESCTRNMGLGCMIKLEW